MVLFVQKKMLRTVRELRYKWLVHTMRAFGVEPDEMTVELLQGVSMASIPGDEQSKLDEWVQWIQQHVDMCSDKEVILDHLCRAMLVREYVVEPGFVVMTGSSVTPDFRSFLLVLHL